MMQHQPQQGVPGQINPTQQETPGPAVFMMVDNEKKEIKLAKKTATGLSIVQLICGLSSFLVQITMIIVITTQRRSYFMDYVTGIGEGIYCGIFFITAGGLGLLASRKPSTCSISAFMTLSIIASIFSAIQIILASIKLGIIDDYSGSRLSWKEPKMAMLSIMVLCGAVEMVVSIISAAVCCGAFCCSGGAPSAARVVYLAQGESGAGVAPVKMAGSVPVQIAGGAPVQMAYPLQSAPVAGVLKQGLNELPAYGDVVNGNQEETKETYGNGAYMRL